MIDAVLVRPKEGHYSFLAPPTLPLGLLSLSSSLAEEGFGVKIIDGVVKKDWKKILKSELQENPVCIGVTSMTGPQIKNALEISRFVKENSDAPVVWGGVHASLLPKQTLENPYIDFVVKGEGEVTFCELVKALKKGKSLKGVKGVWYKKAGKIYNNPDRPFVDLNKLPELSYQFVNPKDYVTKGAELNIESSRGCANKCAFCINQSFNFGKKRALNVDKVIGRIKYTTDFFKCNMIHFIDLNFFSDLKRVKDIAERIAVELPDVSWEGQGHTNDLTKLNKNYIGLLERSNCRVIEVGVESGSPRMLKLLKKNLSLNSVLSFNKVLRSSSIAPKYFFMCGFPTETDVDLQKTIGLVLKLLKENKKAGIVAIFCYTPYPHTELFELSKKFGFRPPSNLEGWSGFNWDTLQLPWLTKRRKKRLERLFKMSIFLGDKSFKLSTFGFLIKIFRPVIKYKLRNYAT